MGIARDELPEDRQARRWLTDPELALSIQNDHFLSIAAEPDSYRRLLETLVACPRLHFTSLSELQAGHPADKAAVAIRHDIDFDICTAATLARLEHDLGVRGCYYVLHTQPYYAHRENGRRFRSRRCVEILLEIQELGHKIGLHNDALHDLVHHGVPVKETLAAELDHLRSHGVRVKGTASHGSYHTYLAANYEVFVGLSISGRTHFIDAKGARHELGQVDMKELGLSYEANYILRSYMISKAEYDRIHDYKFICQTHENDAFERDYDAQFGIFGRDLWLGTNERVQAVRCLTRCEALDGLLSRKPGERIVLDSHPEYYGRTRRRLWRRWWHRTAARLLGGAS